MTDLRAPSTFSDPSRPVPDMGMLQELLVGGDADPLSSFPAECDIDNPRPVLTVAEPQTVDHEPPPRVHADDARIDEILDRLLHVEAECLRVTGALRDIEARVDTGSVDLVRSKNRATALLVRVAVRVANDTACLTNEFAARMQRTSRSVTLPSARAATERVRHGVAQAAGIIATYRRVPRLYGILSLVLIVGIAGAALIRPAGGTDVRSSITPARPLRPHDVRLSDIVLPVVDPPRLSEAPPPAVKSARANITSPAPVRRRDTPARNRGLGFVGTLVIDSVPSGAVVTVDYREVGVTPIQIANLSAGRYVVWLMRDGYSRWTNAVAVPASKVTRVTAHLESQ